MKRRLLPLLLCIAVMFSLPMTASADIGPKPSINIEFNISREEYQNVTYYGTLLSKTSSTGPSSAWDGVPGHERYYGADFEIWQAFVDYVDKDGYYFLQEIWKCSETNTLNWTYYPPASFKILLYFPDTGLYFVSDIYERYAFDSYYTIDLIENMTVEILVAEESYNFTWEIISLVARVVATILIEVAIAFIFGYREKKAIRFIAAVNILTQLVLNMGLNIINYNMGSMAFVLFFVIFEIIVFVIEALLYAKLLKKFTASKADCFKTTAYAFVANLVSFGLGLWIAHIIPGIF